MPLIEIRLTQDEWNRVLGILSQAPWNQANPLIMAIGGQLQAANSVEAPRPNGFDIDAPSTSKQ